MKYLPQLSPSTRAVQTALDKRKLVNILCAFKHPDLCMTVYCAVMCPCKM